MKIGSTTDPMGEAQVLLLLGSNVNAEQQLCAALRCLSDQFALLQVSGAHLSAAVGANGAPSYLNQAAIIQCALDRATLKQILRNIEARLGRQRPSPDPSLCPIDIDCVGRWLPTFELWDAKSFHSDYARPPLRDLGIVANPAAASP